MTTEAIHLYLIRHGNTFNKDETPVQIGSESDLPLTEHGREQALAMARYFNNNNIALESIYSSSLARQKEAAHIISTQLKSKVQVRDNTQALQEINYGEWEGLTTAELHSRWPEEYKAWCECATWPESIFIGSQSDKINELAIWLNGIKHQHHLGDHVAAITSNGTIRYFLSFIKDQWKQLVADCELNDYKVATGHFCHLALGEDDFKIIEWNSKP